jgi:hypothetical protein
MDSFYRKNLHSGGCYKILRVNGIINDLTVTTIWNTEGAKPFRMIKNGIAPFMATINEAPYKL